MKLLPRCPVKLLLETDSLILSLIRLPVRLPMRLPAGRVVIRDVYHTPQRHREYPPTVPVAAAERDLRQ